MYGGQSRVDNPYSISSGVWAIELVAVDNFGNEAKKTIYRWSVLGWRAIFALILFLAVLIVVKMYGLWHRNRQVEKVNSQSGA